MDQDNEIQSCWIDGEILFAVFSSGRSEIVPMRKGIDVFASKTRLVPTDPEPPADYVLGGSSEPYD